MLWDRIYGNSTTSHNSTYVHRRPCGAARATRRCGAPLRHMALRPGWAQGHVTYVRFVMRYSSRHFKRYWARMFYGAAMLATLEV